MTHSLPFRYVAIGIALVAALVVALSLTAGLTTAGHPLAGGTAWTNGMNGGH